MFVTPMWSNMEDIFFTKRLINYTQGLRGIYKVKNVLYYLNKTNCGHFFEAAYHNFLLFLLSLFSTPRDLIIT